MVDQESQTGKAGGDAAKIAEFLRRHPQAIYGETADLARDAGVSHDMVQRAVSRVAITAPPVIDTRSRLRNVPVRRSPAAWITDVWQAVSHDPAIVVVVTTVIGILSTLIFRNEGAPRTRTEGFSFVINAAIPAVVFLLGLLVQAACYFRHGRGRSVLRGSIALYITASLATIVGVILAPGQTLPERLENILLPMLALLFVVAIYALGAMFFSVAGGLWKMRTERVDRDRMSRQELLERLFEVQERLEQTPEEVIEKNSWHNHPVAKEVEQKIWQWSAVLGFGLTAILVLVGGAIMNRYNVGPTSMQYGLTLGLLGFMNLFVQLGVAFLGRTIKRAVLSSLVFSGAGLIAMLLPFGGFGYQRLLEGNGTQLITSFIGALFFGLISGIGSTIESRATQERLMRANDPETLLSEYLDLQRRLNPGPREMTVMVVDAAKSSVMKSMADPYIAEWSFRAYQQLLERLAAENDGEVFSTAGDGAVLTFDDPHRALECAASMQKRIVEFNRNVNKLSMPFRLRIGIHRGTVVGQIDKVQYTDVIDIAAHVEAASQVGGVAISQKVWDALPGLRGEAIAMLIDGFVVYQLELN